MGDFIPSFIQEPIRRQFMVFHPLMNMVEKWLTNTFGFDDDVYKFGVDTKWNTFFDDALSGSNPSKSIALRLIASHRANPTEDSTKRGILVELSVLFIAGVDTSSNTSEYGLTLLAKYPKTQQRLYEELKSVFGELHEDGQADFWARNPIDMRMNINKCHILRAFLEEMLRLTVTAPVGLPHSNEKDVEVELFNEKLQRNVKYVIPKDSVILGDLTSMNKKDKYWRDQMDDPYKLNIDAWLDENGKFKSKSGKLGPNMVSFGVGKRNCAGQSLAKRSLYSMFACLVLRYRFKLPDNLKAEDVKMTQEYFITQRLKPQVGLVVEKRN